MTKPERRLYRFRFGTAVYDEQRESLDVDGQPARLAPRQRGVLSVLLRAPGVVSREDILDELWEPDPDIPTRYVDVAIERLRRSLGANGAFIVAVPRSGYRFDGPVVREEVARELDDLPELAAGGEVPGRPGFELAERLAASDTSQVWLAIERGTGVRHVFKFTADRHRLREFKREYRLAMAAAASLGPRDDLVRVVALHLASTPYWIESEYGGPTLAAWAAEGARLGGLPVGDRLALFLEIATAVAALHTVPIRHGDLKPGNILVGAGPGEPRPRLIDFGSGAQPEIAERLAMTERSAAPASPDADITRGTFEYLAPERFDGSEPTVASDVYALGVLLFKFVAGDLALRMGSDWRARVGDELLEAALAAATRSEPGARCASVEALMDGLRSLERRRQELRRSREMEAALAEARRRQAEVERQRRTAIAVSASLLAGLAAAGTLWFRAESARAQASAAAARAEAALRFLDEDVLGMSDPYSASPLTAALREPLQRAARRADDLKGQPAVEAAVRATLGGLMYKYQDAHGAEAQWKRVAELQAGLAGAWSAPAIQARYRAAAPMSLGGRFDEAVAWMDATDQAARAHHVDDAQTAALGLAAWGQVRINQQRLDLSAPKLEQAMQLVSSRGVDDPALLDAIRRNLVMADIGLQRYEPAIHVATDLVDSLQSRPGIGPLPVALAKNALGQAYLFAGDLARATPLLEASDDVVTERLGPASPATVMTRNARCELYMRHERYPAALDCLLGLSKALQGSTSVPAWMPPAILGNAGIAQLLSNQPDAAYDTFTTARQQLLPTLGAGSGLYQMFGYYQAEVQWRRHRGTEVLHDLDRLDPVVLRSAEADGAWPQRIDLLRGLILADAGDGKRAGELLAKALAELDRLAPKTPERLVPEARRKLATLGGAGRT